MDMNLVQKMRQEQKLILTNEMKLSLQLLQMPILELQEFIEASLEENPILEIDYDKLNDGEDQIASESNKVEAFDYDKLIKINNDENASSISSDIISDDDNDNNPLNYISKKETLKDYLLNQIIDLSINEEVRHTCEYLIALIDDDGFIKEDIINIACELKKPVEIVRSALLIIQDLQPCGIGARDFRESLMIQLKKKKHYDKTIIEIIYNYLELVADNKMKELCKILGITLGKLQQYIDLIKSLEPKPARGFYTGEETGYIIPEAFLKKVNNDFYIIMNDSVVPRLNVNHYYQQMLQTNNNSEVVEFMRDKVSSAVYLIKGIEQRRHTIYRIIEKIVEYQKVYFDKGNNYLKPMILKDVAMDLNLNESTISRAIKDKYISVPSGTIRLKDLFTNGIISDGDEDVSTNIIKKEIEQIIKSEDKEHPLSDQEIAVLLKQSNINISRRTVAKYRESLEIRASSKRRIFVTNDYEK